MQERKINIKKARKVHEHDSNIIKYKKQKTKKKRKTLKDPREVFYNLTHFLFYFFTFSFIFL